MARKDFDLISEWIEPNSRILDLGCGDGSLLKLLNSKRNVTGYGVDSSIDKTIKSLDNKINIINKFPYNFWCNNRTFITRDYCNCFHILMTINLLYYCKIFKSLFNLSLTLLSIF